MSSDEITLEKEMSQQGAQGKTPEKLVRKLPEKALTIGPNGSIQLGDSLSGSGHAVVKCHITDEQGNKRLAFYKPLDPTYPEILAKYSVAFMVLAGMALGKRAADTRLVYDEQGALVGTLSIALDDLHCMQTVGEADELDPIKVIKRNPSAAYLMEGNYVEIATAFHRHKDDDTHPHNFANGVFDPDMFYYNITNIAKRMRFIGQVLQNLPEKDTAIDTKDLHLFPQIEGRTHWPTNTIPGNINVAKTFKNRDEFLKLKSNPSIPTADGGTVSFHQQWYSAMLKELLSFQPQVLKERLKAYLGDEPFDLDELYAGKNALDPEQKKEKFKQKFPELINAGGPGSFVEHCCQFFQQEYNEYAQVVVPYQGHKHKEPAPCASEGIELGQEIEVENPSFCKFLHLQPAAFRDIRKLFIERNDTFLAAKATALESRLRQIKTTEEIEINKKILTTQKALAAFASSTSDNSAAQTFLNEQLARDTLEIKARHKLRRGEVKEAIDALFDEAQLYDIKALNNHYHLIYRDAFQHKLQENCYDRLNNLRKKIGSEHNAYQALSELYQQLRLAGNTYYDKASLVNQDNLDFLIQMTACFNADILSNINKLLDQESDQIELTETIRAYKTVLGQLDFAIHLTSANKPLDEADKAFKTTLYKDQNDPQVIDDFLKAFFDWARLRLDSNPKLFLDIIGTCIEEYSNASYAGRAKEILAYIKDSTEKPSQKLAHVLSHGATKSNSLNTIITAKISEYMVDDIDFSRNLSVNLKAVREVIKGKKNTFNKKLYADKIQAHAQDTEAFNYLYAPHTMEKIFTALIDWAEVFRQENSAGFKLVVNQAELAYKELSYRQERLPEVEQNFSRISSGKDFLLASFSLGGVDTSSFNTAAIKVLIETLTAQKADQKGFEFLHRFRYTSAIDWCKFAKNMQNFAMNKAIHLNIDSQSLQVSSFEAPSDVLRLHKLIYDWADKPDNAVQFKDIMTTALTLYGKSSWNFWSGGSRKAEIGKIIEEKTTASNKLSRIFAEGGTEGNSFNTLAFKALFQAMVADNKSTAGLEILQTFKVAQFNWTPFLQSMEQFAKSQQTGIDIRYDN